MVSQVISSSSCRDGRPWSSSLGHPCCKVGSCWRSIPCCSMCPPLALCWGSTIGPCSAAHAALQVVSKLSPKSRCRAIGTRRPTFRNRLLGRSPSLLRPLLLWLPSRGLRLGAVLARTATALARAPTAVIVHRRVVPPTFIATPMLAARSHCTSAQSRPQHTIITICQYTIHCPEGDSLWEIGLGKGN